MFFKLELDLGFNSDEFFFFNFQALSETLILKLIHVPSPHPCSESQVSEHQRLHS